MYLALFQERKQFLQKYDIVKRIDQNVDEIIIECDTQLKKKISL